MPFLDLFKAQTIIHAVSSHKAFYEKQNYEKYAVISFNFRRMIFFVLKRYYLIIYCHKLVALKFLDIKSLGLHRYFG